VLAHTSIDLSEGSGWIKQMGMRYANTRGLSELMANACHLHAPYADTIRECLQEINGTAERAMGLSLSGDPAGAVRSLLQHSEATLNVKLLDMSQQVLLRHQARISEAEPLQRQIDALRGRCGTTPARAVLGQDSERQPGGVTLRLRKRAEAKAQAAESLQAMARPADAQATPRADSKAEALAQGLDALRLRPGR